MSEAQQKTANKASDEKRHTGMSASHVNKDVQAALNSSVPQAIGNQTSMRFFNSAAAGSGNGGENLSLKSFSRQQNPIDNMTAQHRVDVVAHNPSLGHRSVPLAQTTNGRTSVRSEVLSRADAPSILAHESVHRAQYKARGKRPEGNRSQLEQDAHVGGTALLAGDFHEPHYAAPTSMTLTWCAPGTECNEYPADFIGPLPEGAERASGDRPEIVQIPEEDIIRPGAGDFLVAISGASMIVLPAVGNYVQFRPPASAEVTTPASTPLVTMPTIGKNAMRVVNVGSRTGFALDAGGRPSVVFPSAMSQIQNTLGVTSISGVLIMHIHQDHVESLEQLVVSNGIRPENIRVPAAFTTNVGAPSSDLARSMQALQTRMGSNAQFGTIQTPSGTGGVFHNRLVEGEVVFDMYGLTGEFNELENRRTRSARQPNADRASLLVRTTHTPTGTAVLFLGDLRGADLTEFRNQMGAEEYSRMMRGVRVVSGFQHHMGALESAADRAGLVEFLSNSLVANRGLSLVIQSQEEYRGRQYLNRSLIEALNRVGVNVHVAGEASAGGGAATIMSNSNIVVSGQGVETFRAARGMETHLRRLGRLIEAQEILAAQRHNVQNGEARFRSVSAARVALEGAINDYVRTSLEGVGSGATGRGSSRLTNEPAMARSLARVEAEAPIEMELMFSGTMQQLREVRRLGPHLDTFTRELELSRRSGRLSEAGIEALWELNPTQAQRLVKTSGMPRREVRRVQQQLPGAPISAGRGAVGWGLVIVSVLNEVGPVVGQYRRNAYNYDVGTFMGDILFWQSTGVQVDLTAVDDNWAPFYDNEYTSDVTRVNELIAENELDYLAITGIPDDSAVARIGNWDRFGLWAQHNIKNLGDWRALIADNDALQYEGDHITDRQWSYRTGSISGTTFGISLEIEWHNSVELTTILNAAAEHVVQQSTSEIEALEQGPGSDVGQRAYRAAPPEHSHRSLYNYAPQAEGLVRFREGLSDTDLYTLINQRSRSFESDILLYRFPDSAVGYPVPEGYVVVGGADYNSYLNVSGTSNLLQMGGINQYGNAYTYTGRGHSEFFLAREEDLAPASR